MGLTNEHEIHTRRKGRNIGVGLVLVGFVVIVFGMTFVKVSRTDFRNAPIAGGENGN